MATSPTATKPKSSTYNGGCHCGRVKTAQSRVAIVGSTAPATAAAPRPCRTGETIEVIDQQIPGSICSKHGLLMVYPLDANIEWLSGFDDMTTYTFGPERVSHMFCSICGSYVRGKSTDPNVFADNTAINVRTLDGVDLDKLHIRKFDGKNKQW